MKLARGSAAGPDRGGPWFRAAVLGGEGPHDLLHWQEQQQPLNEWHLNAQAVWQDPREWE